MELTFTKSSDSYIAEFTASSHFNLHIEGGGNISVYRKTSGEGWDYLTSDQGSVLDSDYGFSVYPKDMRIVCSKEPSMAVLTYNE